MAAITLTLDDAEQQAFAGLLDLSLRQAGLNCLDAVCYFKNRL
jgi:hypothetical protein